MKPEIEIQHVSIHYTVTYTVKTKEGDVEKTESRNYSDQASFPFNNKHELKKAYLEKSYLADSVAVMQKQVETFEGTTNSDLDKFLGKK